MNYQDAMKLSRHQLHEAETAAVRQQYATYWPLATQCALLAERGRIEEATAVGDRLLKIKLGYSLAYARQAFSLCAHRNS